MNETSKLASDRGTCGAGTPGGGGAHDDGRGFTMLQFAMLADLVTPAVIAGSRRAGHHLLIEAEAARSQLHAVPPEEFDLGDSDGRADRSLRSLRR